MTSQKYPRPGCRHSSPSMNTNHAMWLEGHPLNIPTPQTSHLGNGDNDSYLLLGGLSEDPARKTMWTAFRRTQDAGIIKKTMIYYYYHYQNIIRAAYLLVKLGRKDMTASDLILSSICEGMMLLAWCLSLSNQQSLSRREQNMNGIILKKQVTPTVLYALTKEWFCEGD